FEIVGTAVERTHQINTGGKNIALGGNDNRARPRCAQLVEALEDVLAENGVHGIGLAVLHGQHGNVAAKLKLDHAGDPPPCAMRSRAITARSPWALGSASRCAWMTASVSTAIAMVWCASASASGTTYINVRIPKTACTVTATATASAPV